MSFVEVTTWKRIDDARFRADIGEEWFQGRGAYGGLTAGAIVRAAEQFVDDETRVIRSLTVHFAAPLGSGAAELTLSPERSGRRVSHLSARVESAGVVAAFATLTFAADRPEVARYDNAAMPPMRSPDEIPTVERDLLAPPFARFFDFRFAYGAPLFSGGEPRLGGWLRLKEPTLLDAALVAGYLDAVPPAVLATLTEPRPGATVDFTIHFFERPPAGVEADDFCGITVSSRWAASGYSEELRELWSPNGTRIGQCRQLVATF